MIAVCFVCVPFIVGVTIFFLKPMLVGCAAGWMYLFASMTFGGTKAWFLQKGDHLSKLAGHEHFGD